MVEGIARAIDADTLAIGDERIRLIGIDAPEREQVCEVDGTIWPCGRAAGIAMATLLGKGPVRCEVHGRDRWQRALAVCFLDDVDLSAEIVRAGWALAWYPRVGAIAGPTYEAEQREAGLKLAGIWRGTFIDPWEWRHRRN